MDINIGIEYRRGFHEGEKEVPGSGIAPMAC